MERHHFMFPASLHEAQSASRELRQMSRSTGYLDHDSHVELHQSISGVPVLSHYVALGALKHVRDSFIPDNPVERIEDLQRAIEVSMRQPRADRIEREIAELAVYALDIQKPFFDDALPTRLVVPLHEKVRRHNDIYKLGGGYDRQAA